MNYVLVVCIISLMILLHELGHFLAARYCGIPIEAFSIGFGPAVWKKRIGGTEFRFSVIPVGGYILPAVGNEDDFFRIPIYKRIIFSFGGPAANLVTALALFGIINSIGTGFSLAGAFIQPFQQTFSLVYKIAASFSGLFTQHQNLSGIVGILQQGGAFISADYLKALQFAVIISVNFAVFNLLPLPVLDGGKILLCLIEKINARLTAYYAPIMIAGWVIIIGLMIYATVLDAARLMAYA